MWIFGWHSVLEAIEQGKALDKVLVQKGAKNAALSKIQPKVAENGGQMQTVPKAKLDRLVRNERFKSNHQGIAAFLSLIDYYQLEDIIPKVYEEGGTPLFLLLDGITDVRNLGAIARTAECMGAQALIVPGAGSAEINALAIKTSAGALNRLWVTRTKSLSHAIEYLKLNGIQVLGSSLKGKRTLKEMPLADPIAIVLGSEDAGMSKEVSELCDHHFIIPMAGNTQSLNVSVSAGMMLYECLSQRNL